jgi:phosphate transport system substrate-binding protein
MYRTPLRPIALAAAFCAAAALTSSVAFAQPTIRLDGSSTVFPIMEAVAEEFQKAAKGKVRVTVGISGTGGGFRKFCRGETDIQNASRPISKSEMEECRKNGVQYVELPIAFDALSVVVHPKNKWLTQITLDELRTIWEPAAQGKIMRWNQVNPAWPDAPIALFGAGTDSGTFDYFTSAVMGKSRASRPDFTASEDDNVLVQGVARNVNAMGFFGFSYYWENRHQLRALPIVPRGGTVGVSPSPETVLNGTYTPLSRPVFIYVSAKELGRPEVRDFVLFANKNAEKLVREVRYVPLPAKIYAHNIESVVNPAIGTRFGGTFKVGITMDELVRLELVH